MAVEVVHCRNSETGGEADLPVTALALDAYSKWKPVGAEAKLAVKGVPTNG